MQEEKMKMIGAEKDDDAARRRMAAPLAAVAVAGVLSAGPAIALDSSRAKTLAADRLIEAVRPSGWGSAPRMQVEREFAGPLTDTMIHRWRDPDNGTLCYIYLPILARHAALTTSETIVYGANTIGSISCTPPATAPVSRRSTP